MNTKGTLDVVAVVWFLLFSYLTAVSFLFGSLTLMDPTMFILPAALIPSVLWLGWRAFNREGFFYEPTAQQTIFLGGLLGLIAIAQYFDITHALTQMF